MRPTSNAALCVGLLLGCSSAERASTSEPIARTSPLAALATVAQVAPRLGKARALTREGAAFIAAAGGLRVRLPATASGTMHLERSPLVWLDVAAEGLGDVEGVADHEALVYRDVLPDMDRVELFDGEVVEELRVLRTPRAKTTFAWRVHLGPGLEKLTVTSGVVQALDSEGRARLRTEPIVAWDARGRERALTVEVQPLGPAEARLVARLDATGLAYPVTVDPAWGATAKMANGRYDATPVLLPSGRVFVAGGRSVTGAYLASAEVFDPAALTWTLVNPMKAARAQHASTLLPDGRVMVVAGTAGTSLSSCEYWSPASNSWVDGPALPAAVYALAAVAVGGKVAAGGGAGNTANTYTLGDPAGAWVASPTKLGTGRYGLVAIAYSATRALFIGGSAPATDIYDAATNTFAPGPAMTAGRTAPGVARLTSGRLIIVGGYRTDSELFDPTTSTLTTVAGIGTPHDASFSIAALAGDKAIFSGSYSTNTAIQRQTHIFDGGSGSWSNGPDATVARHGALSIGLPDGRALAAGGVPPNSTTSAVNDSEVFADNVAGGSSCTTGAQCASSFCVQGVCCDRACSGTCESCAEATSSGTCIAITGNPRTGHGTCSGSGTCGGVCDGTSASCTYAAGSVACVTGSCVGGLEQPVGYCSGSGSCPPPAPTKSCGVFTCGALACKTACTTDADCIAGRFCNTATSFCDAKLPNGGACTAASGCASGFCAPGGSSGSICCDKACTGACETCGASGSVGLCQARVPCSTDAGADGAADTGATPDTRPDTTSDATSEDTGRGIAEAGAPQLPPKPEVTAAFQRCTNASECSTGFCVDGVCCNTACEDRCHSCALLSAPGICTLAPVGVDLRNECGPANQCLGTCDGSGQCIGAGNGTMCGRNRCTGSSTGAGPAFCSGPGAKCPTNDAVPFECSPYACEPAFGACRSTCSSSAECANGFVCDVPAKACVPPPPAGDEGGCTYGARNSNSIAGLLLGLALAVRARRARGRLVLDPRP